MEISLVLFALGAAACYFFRNNTKRGLESVRAQVFLSGVLSGHTVSDANYAARFGIIGQPPPEVIQSATALSKAEPTVKVEVRVNLASCLWPIVWLIAVLAA